MRMTDLQVNNNHYLHVMAVNIKHLGTVRYIDQL